MSDGHNSGALALDGADADALRNAFSEYDGSLTRSEAESALRKAIVDRVAEPLKRVGFSKAQFRKAAQDAREDADKAAAREEAQSRVESLIALLTKGRGE